MKKIFSPTEDKILKIIGRKRSMNTKEICDEFYQAVPKFAIPKNYRTIISNAINRINFKCKKHKLDWKLDVYNFGCKGKMVGKIQCN